MINRLKYSKYVITVSYGDYTSGTGGTDKFILSQQRLLNEYKISMLYIYPKPDILGKRIHSDKMWGVLMDGKYYAMTNTFGILKLINKLQGKGLVLSGVIIHHLNNASLNEMYKILKAIDARIYMYLHDFYTICPSSGLLRDYHDFCGVSFPNEQKCLGCTCLSETTIKRARQIAEFIKKISNRTLFIFPSQSALENWREAYPEKSFHTTVILHQILSGEYKANMSPVSDSEPLRIAYVGYQAPHKGWAEWKEAVKRSHEAGCNYLYYQMGSCNEKIDFVQKCDIDFKKDINAMITALRENKIDCAVLWSLWPETYSFTFYESYSANCYILTNQLSGNIAAMVKQKGNGTAAENKNDLSALLLDESGLREKINSFRKKKEYGPDRLIENDAIVKLLRSDKKRYSVFPAHRSYSDYMSGCLLKVYSVYTYFRRKHLK